MRPATVHVNGALIERVSAWNDVPAGKSVHEAGDRIVMAGLVDTHVHINEPGRTEWEGFSTATRAAAAGGVTTVLDMPLNAIPATTSVAGLDAKRAAAIGQCHVNVGFIGGVIPGNVNELKRLARAGVFAFKSFLVPSGVDEFLAVSENDLRQAFPVLAELGLPLMVHAEHPAFIRDAVGARDKSPRSSGSRDSEARGNASRDIGSRRSYPRGNYADYLASRPAIAEQAAIELLLRLHKQRPVPIHIVHLSSALGLSTLRAARAHDPTITVETCPHYLTWCARDVPEGATEYKCAPPIRDASDRDALWSGLTDGSIDMIVSDHSPCLPTMKDTDGNFFTAWGGIASLQLGLSAVWTEAKRRDRSVADVARWMCEAPARLVGLDQRKGHLAAGFDADITVWDADADFVVDPARLQHRQHVTPYAGRRLRGVVNTTFVGGRLAYHDGVFPAPVGTLLTP